MDLPKRKPIRLKKYDYSRNGAYFITICTKNRSHIFGEIVGATLCGRPNRPDKMVEKWLFELENKFKNIEIDNYIIMPDHIHFILFNHGVTNTVTGDHLGSPLPEIIDWFKTMTTNEYIRGVRKNLFPPFDKHLWQRSYHDHIIRNQKEYRTISKYIYENPAKWEEDCYFKEKKCNEV